MSFLSRAQLSVHNVSHDPMSHIPHILHICTPIFYTHPSPYSDYGIIPTDTVGPSKCGAHYSDALGWHYHAVIGYGELKNAFVVCYKGYRAVQEWDGTVYDEDDSVTPSDCPATTYTEAHNIEDSMGRYFTSMGVFSANTCGDGKSGERSNG